MYMSYKKVEFILTRSVSFNVQPSSAFPSQFLVLLSRGLIRGRVIFDKPWKEKRGIKVKLPHCTACHSLFEGPRGTVYFKFLERIWKYFLLAISPHPKSRIGISYSSRPFSVECLLPEGETKSEERLEGGNCESDDCTKFKRDLAKTLPKAFFLMAFAM